MGSVVLPYLRWEALEAGVRQAEANLRQTEAMQRQTAKDMAARVVGDLAMLHDAQRQVEELEGNLMPRAQADRGGSADGLRVGRRHAQRRAGGSARHSDVAAHDCGIPRGAGEAGGGYRGCFGSGQLGARCSRDRGGITGVGRFRRGFWWGVYRAGWPFMGEFARGAEIATGLPRGDWWGVAGVGGVTDLMYVHVLLLGLDGLGCWGYRGWKTSRRREGRARFSGGDVNMA